MIIIILFFVKKNGFTVRPDGSRYSWALPSFVGAAVVDVRTYMNPAPLAVSLDFPARRAHDLFLSLGLRHLVVVDEEHVPRGVITRKDLIDAR